MFKGILPEAPSFGTQLARGLGGGIGTGISQATEMAQKLAAKKAEANENVKLLKSLRNQSNSSSSVAERLAGNQGNQRNEQNEISDDQIALLAATKPELAKVLQEQKKSGRKQFEAERAFHWDRAKKVLAEADEGRSSTDQAKLSLGVMKNAIEKDEVGLFSPSNLSQTLSSITGVDLPLDASGAQLATAQKNMLVNTLGLIGGRPNQYIEQQISKGFPRIGQSKKANTASFLPAEASIDLKTKYYEALDELDQYYMDKQGYPPANIATLAQQKIRPYVDERLKKLEADLKSNEQSDQPEKKANNFSSLEQISEKRQPNNGDLARNKTTNEQFVWKNGKWHKVK